MTQKSNPFQLRKISKIGILLLLLIFCSHCVLRPSGNLTNYESYFPHDNQTNPISKGKVRATFLGTSSILLDDGETQILTDGFFSRPSIWKTAFSKIESEPKTVLSVIERAKIKRLKAIFVCHSHYDHVMDAPFVAKQTKAILYGSSSTLNVGTGAGLTIDQMQKFEPGKPISIGKFKITVLESKHTPAFHILGKTNATDPNHPNIDSPLVQPVKVMDFIEGGTFDFFIQHGKNKILIKSSTNFVEGALDKLNADVLFLGIAQISLQPISFQDEYYKQTVQTLKPKLLIPIHWDNFFKPLSEPLEPNLQLGDDFDANMKSILKRSEGQKIEIKLLQGFESIDLF
ncbi:MBL fold metallo-hydrolase [Leptospira harrisiae]|uniref:Hydrolase n=1 Tax=Leptospira harrisiae TaxID=2023189 RepID=A0A2N0AKA0_9LEPT|nr:MBL fold metallo-hydrolase [Leptospira harrisiae]PJZ84687.1 hydrolase [Leptospira harrisiae]PKA08107.1 hydrolase [Leptospira harrisiae]